MHNHTLQQQQEAIGAVAAAEQSTALEEREAVPAGVGAGADAGEASVAPEEQLYSNPRAARADMPGLHNHMCVR